MIYIFRHQEASHKHNILSGKGVADSILIADVLKKCLNGSNFIQVFTCAPNIVKDKHVRPLQTASLVASKLNTNVHFTNYVSLPKNFHVDQVIFWDHSNIPKILQSYFPTDTITFQWDDDDYSSCVIISQKTGYRFEKDFIRKHTKLTDKIKNFFRKKLY